MSGPFDVFLSHNSKDKPAVRQLAKALQERGLQVWLDEEELVPGRPWQKALEEIIQKARTAAVLVGQDGLGPWEIPEMRACLSQFVNRGLPVIPVLLPDAPSRPELPLFLQEFTWVDLRGGLTDDGLKRLEWGITGVKPGQSPGSAEDRLRPLPAELQQSTEDPRPWVREGAARHLGELLQHSNQRLAIAAHAALLRLAEDDSQKVRAVVAELLKAYADDKPLIGEPTATTPSEEARPTLPAIQAIHGWSAQQVQALQQQTAQALGLRVEFRNRLQDGRQGPLMVVIPGGRFLMGSPQNEPGRSSDERQHEVEVKPFAIGKYAVIFEEYDYFAGVTRHKNPVDKGWGREGWGRGRRPVIRVGWHDAVAYTEWLSQQTGQTYRLPTEAEWEYACRAGTTTAYHFGAFVNEDLANYNEDLANYNEDLANYSGDGFFEPIFPVLSGRTVEVGRYPANAWGLHDMHGNVLEWTCSVYNEDYGGSEQRCEEPNTGGSRVLRGGGFNFAGGRLLRLPRTQPARRPRLLRYRFSGGGVPIVL